MSVYGTAWLVGTTDEPVYTIGVDTRQRAGVARSANDAVAGIGNRLRRSDFYALAPGLAVPLAGRLPAGCPDHWEAAFRLGVA